VIAELTGSLSNLAATVMSPAVAAAAPMIDRLSKAIEAFGNAVGDFNKKHPNVAPAEAPAAIAAGGLASLWGATKVFGWVKGLLGLGGGGGGVGAGPGTAAAGSGLGRIIAAGVGAGSLPGLVNLLTDDNRTPQAKANDTRVLDWIKSQFVGPGAPMALPGATAASPIGAPFGLYRPATLGPGRDVHSPSAGPYAYYPPGPQQVSVSGAATVEQQLTVRIEASPLLQAIVDQARQQSERTVPLIGDGSGRMDSDAGPHRPGGIGRM
jgi:hypothetical protein